MNPSELAPFCRLDEQLLQIERQIALLERVRPLNFASALSRLQQDLQADSFSTPELVYGAPLSSSTRLASELFAIQVSLSAVRLDGALSQLQEMFLARIAELRLELLMAQSVGSSDFVTMAASRYLPEETLCERAQDLAHAWLEQAHSASESPQEISQDGEQKEVRLVSYFVDKARALSFSFPVVERDIASIAAATHEGLVVQRGASVCRKDAERLWLHEVHAHLLPRLNVEQKWPLLLCGAVGSDRDEEGRALLLELRKNLSDKKRKQEIAVRYLLSCAVLSQQDLGHVARRLIAQGASQQCVAHCALRALRGGGLGRDVIYLTGLVHVEHALAQNPEDEAWLMRGRASVELARLYAPFS